MAQESPPLPPQSPPLSPITILLQAGTNDVDAPVPSDVSEGLRDDARGRGDEEDGGVMDLGKVKPSHGKSSSRTPRTWSPLCVPLMQQKEV